MQRLILRCGLVLSLLVFFSGAVFAAAPIALPDNYRTGTGQPLNVPAPGVLANDTDADGDQLSAIVTSNPVNGALRFNANGSFTYEPRAGFTGTDTFTYRASDGTSPSAPVTVTIAVGGGQPPIAESDNYEVSAGQTLEVVAPGVLTNDRDPDPNTTLIAVSPSSPANGTLTLRSNGSFTYVPRAGFVGSDTFTYRASDGVNLSNTTLVTIVVRQVVVPVANNDSYTVPINTTLNIPATEGVRANDTNFGSVAPATFNAVLVAGVSHGTISLNNDGSFSYFPNPNYIGPDSFSYKLSNGSVESNVATVIIDVLAPPPTNLVAVGNLNLGIVRPALTWTQPMIAGSVTIVPVQWYQIMVMNSANATLINKWVQIGELCNPVNAFQCSYIPTEAELPVGFINGTYTWQVRSWGSNVYSQFSTPSTFTVNVPPPVLQGFTVSGQAGRPVITLPNDPNTAYFHVWLGTPNFEARLFDWFPKTAQLCSTGPCILAPDVGLTNGDYVVYVQAWGPGGFNNNDMNSWQGPQSFTLNAVSPPTVTQLNVSVNAGVPTFTWEGSDDLTWYEIWVGAAGEPPVMQLNQWYDVIRLGCLGGGTCTLIPDNLTVGTGVRYIWYVRAWGPGGYTTGGLEGWTEGPSFTP